MPIETAVAPSVRSPGAYLKVNLLAGAPSPGNGADKVLVISAKSSSGTITANTEVKRAVSGPDAMAGFAGQGTPAHLVAKKLFKEYPLAQVDYVAPATPAGVAASFNITLASTPTIAQTFELYVMGRFVVALTWGASETADAFKLRVIDAVNSKTADIAVVASSGGVGIVGLAFKFAGVVGNDVKVRAYLRNGSGGTINGGVSINSALSGGTLSQDPATVLGLVQLDEYFAILMCEGNTEANTSGANTAYAKVQAHIDGYDEGLNALLQTQVIGYTGSVATAITAGGYRNNGTAQLAVGQDFEDLPCEVAATELGQRLREVATNPAKNRIDMAYTATLYGPADPVASRLSIPQRESLLQNGCTPIEFDTGTRFFPKRPVTTYFKDTNNNADDRLLDLSRIDGTYAVAKDLRAAIPQQFPGKSLSKNLPEGTRLPADVVEEKTIKTFAINRVRFWANTRGVVQSAALEEAITGGSFICQVDASDSSQLDLVVPLKIIAPLAKFSIVVNHVGP